MATTARKNSTQLANSSTTDQLVTVKNGTVSVDQESIGTTIRTIIASADVIGDFWRRWGVSAALFIIGTFATIVAFVAHAIDAKAWGDDAFFGALAFALTILALGFVAFVDKQNRAGRTEQQAIEIYRITVDASLDGQRIGAEERKAAKPKLENQLHNSNGIGS
ncbi:MAG TPA: hypothetical protein VHV49_12055 [Pseudonocardiaceae bacterium]|nr:hypothetical protein [Pseudonocardiaceae bacterium]